MGVYYMQGACATEDAADGSIGADRPEQPAAWRAALPAAGSCCTRQRGRDVACAEILDGGVRDARESERGGRKVKGTPHKVVARARGPGLCSRMMQLCFPVARARGTLTNVLLPGSGSVLLYPSVVCRRSKDERCGDVLRVTNRADGSLSE